MLMSGLPVFHKDDINRDSSVDLQDVILVVKNVAKTAYSASGFISSVSKALSTLSAAAGLKTIIMKDKDKGAYFSIFSGDFPCLPSILPTINTSNNYSKIYVFSKEYTSNIITPEYPPPQTSLI